MPPPRVEPPIPTVAQEPPGRGEGGVDVDQPRSGADHRRAVGAYRDIPQRREVDDDAVVRGREAGVAVPAGAGRERDAAAAHAPDRGADIGGRGDPGDRGRLAGAERRVERLGGRVVAGVAGAQQPAGQRPLQGRIVDAGRGGGVCAPGRGGGMCGAGHGGGAGVGGTSPAQPGERQPDRGRAADGRQGHEPAPSECRLAHGVLLNSRLVSR
jgi:hypothetical protein